MCISLAIGMVPVKWLRPSQHWGLKSEAQKTRKWNWPEWYITQLGREQGVFYFLSKKSATTQFSLWRDWDEYQHIHITRTEESAGHKHFYSSITADEEGELHKISLTPKISHHLRLLRVYYGMACASVGFLNLLVKAMPESTAHGPCVALWSAG